MSKLRNYFDYIVERKQGETFENYLQRCEWERLQITPLICESSIYSPSAEQASLDSKILDLELACDDDLIRFRRK